MLNHVQSRFAAWSLLAVALLAALVPTDTAVAQFTFTVNDTLDGGDANRGDSICATARGTCTIRAALEEINEFGPSCENPDQVIVPAGHYVLAPGSPSLGVAGRGWDVCVEIHGTSDNEGAATVIDGNAPRGLISDPRQDRILTVMPLGHVLLKGITLRNSHHHILGGAIANEGDLYVLNSLITQNSTHHWGGGIFNKGIMKIFESTLSNNWASANVSAPSEAGAGIANWGGEAELINVTISGNTTSSSSHGGGIVNTAGGVIWMNTTTITRNSSDTKGGGIYNAPGSSVNLVNTILAQNTAASSRDSDDCSGTLTSWGYNLVGIKSNDFWCSMVLAAGDTVGSFFSPVDPMLAALTDNGGPTPTHALRPGSPAIDTGSPDPWPDTGSCYVFDQRFVPRPKDGPTGDAPSFDGVSRCDKGAYEYAAPRASIGDKSVTEGNTGTKNMAFPIELDFFQPEPITIEYATASGTALAGSDFRAASGTVTFNPGELRKTVVVKVIGDRVAEPNETFSVNINALLGTKVRIGDETAVGTILNND